MNFNLLYLHYHKRFFLLDAFTHTFLPHILHVLLLYVFSGTHVEVRVLGMEDFRISLSGLTDALQLEVYTLH